MVKPSLMSVGLGIGVLMLGGSGITIPALWSRASRAEEDRNTLHTSLRELREARTASDDALLGAKLQMADLRADLETANEALATALESKNLLTRELAELQVRNRELTATEGTLELRNQEMATLVQQLAQVRSDHATLLAEREATTTTNDPVPVPVPSNMARPGKTTSPAEPTRDPSQVVAKPDVSAPVRFDDTGWKSVAPVLPAYGF